VNKAYKVFLLFLILRFRPITARLSSNNQKNLYSGVYNPVNLNTQAYTSIDIHNKGKFKRKRVRGGK